MPDVTNPFFARVLRGAQRAAQEAGYTVALVDTGNDRRWEEQSFEALRAGPVDGYLLFEVMPPEGLAADEQVVLIESRAPRRSSVRFDSEGGAAAAFEHLLKLGHRRIGHLAADFDAPTFHLREDARRRVLSGAGLDPDALPRAVTQITIDDARDAAGPLLDEQPTAVFCDDDIVAAGLYLAARERGLRIPRDLSVIGFDDMDFARVLDPALTTVALDAELLGATAFGLLEERMGGGRPRRPIVLPAELVRTRLDRAAAMTDAARAAFEAHAEGYDAERRRLLPCFDAFYAAAVEAVGLSGRPPGRVLDLGAGTGLLAGFVARGLPGGASSTLLDGAGAMLAQARERLGERASYVVGDLVDPLPEGPWDAIVSALAIHHLDDPAKRDLFARVRAALAPGGLFVNAEQVAGESAWLDVVYVRTPRGRGPRPGRHGGRVGGGRRAHGPRPVRDGRGPARVAALGGVRGRGLPVARRALRGAGGAGLTARASGGLNSITEEGLSRSRPRRARTVPGSRRFPTVIRVGSADRRSDPRAGGRRRAAPRTARPGAAS